MCQVAGVVVGSGSGRVEAEGRQGGHAEILGRVVGTEAPQVILGHRAGRHHVVHRPLQAGGKERVTVPPCAPGVVSPPPGGTGAGRGHPHPAAAPVHSEQTHLRGGKRESWTTELGGSPKE